MKKYLLDNYDVRENIHRTMNGINLEKFKDDDLPGDNRAIVHISRLEENTSIVAAVNRIWKE